MNRCFYSFVLGSLSLSLLGCAGAGSTTPADAPKTVYNGPALSDPQVSHGWKTGTDETEQTVYAPPAPPPTSSTNTVVSGPKLVPPQTVSGWQTAGAPASSPPVVSQTNAP